MVAVQCIPAAAEVVIASVRCEHVIDIIVKALERKTGSQLIALRGVVEDDVKDDFDPVLVELFDELFQFQTFPVILKGRTIACIRGEEAHRIVSPVIQKFILIDQAHIPHLVELKDRHQFHGIDPELFQIRNLLF